MSGPPRRKSVPPAPPQSFDDERPTPIASAIEAPTTTTTHTQTKTQTDMELAPEPPTILAISITAPSFKSSDQVPAARLPLPDVAVTGPFAKTHVREGEGRTVLDMPKVTPPTPSGKVTAPSFSEAARSGPFSKTTNARVGDSETVSERIQLPPGETTPPPGPPPVAPPQARSAPPVPLPPPKQAGRSSAPERKALDRKPTEVSDPWEYAGDVPQQAAALSGDYESGGVELDPSGRLVAPGMKRRKREVSEVSAVADLLSMADDVWPEAPPQAPPAPPRVEPVADVAPPPPPEPDTAPRAPPPPRRAPPPARVPSPRKPAVAHAETVLRAPRSQLDAEPEVDPEEQFFEESESGVVTEEPSAADPVPTPTPVRDYPSRSNPRRLTSDEERYGLDEDYGPEGAAGPTDLRGPVPEEEEESEESAYDDRFDDEPFDEQYEDDANATGRRAAAPPLRRRTGSRWPLRLFLLALLGGGFGGAWLWATGQWESVLAWFGLR